MWNFEGNFSLNLRKAEMVDVHMQFTVFDHDPGGIKNFLGYLEVSADTLIAETGKWSNEIWQLLDSKGTPGKNGLLYFLS